VRACVRELIDKAADVASREKKFREKKFARTTAAKDFFSRDIAAKQKNKNSRAASFSSFMRTKQTARKTVSRTVLHQQQQEDTAMSGLLFTLRSCEREIRDAMAKYPPLERPGSRTSPLASPSSPGLATTADQSRRTRTLKSQRLQQSESDLSSSVDANEATMVVEEEAFEFESDDDVASDGEASTAADGGESDSNVAFRANVTAALSSSHSKKPALMSDHRAKVIENIGIANEFNGIPLYYRRDESIFVHLYRSQFSENRVSRTHFHVLYAKDGARVVLSAAAHDMEAEYHRKHPGARPANLVTSADMLYVKVRDNPTDSRNGGWKRFSGLFNADVRAGRTSMDRASLEQVKRQAVKDGTFRDMSALIARDDAAARQQQEEDQSMMRPLDPPSPLPEELVAPSPHPHQHSITLHDYPPTRPFDDPEDQQRVEQILCDIAAADARRQQQQQAEDDGADHPMQQEAESVDFGEQDHGPLSAASSHWSISELYTEDQQLPPLSAEAESAAAATAAATAAQQQQQNADAPRYHPHMSTTVDARAVKVVAPPADDVRFQSGTTSALKALKNMRLELHDNLNHSIGKLNERRAAPLYLFGDRRFPVYIHVAKLNKRNRFKGYLGIVFRYNGRLYDNHNTLSNQLTADFKSHKGVICSHRANNFKNIDRARLLVNSLWWELKPGTMASFGDCVSAKMRLGIYKVDDAYLPPVSTRHERAQMPDTEDDRPEHYADGDRIVPSGPHKELASKPLVYARIDRDGVMIEEDRDEHEGGEEMDEDTSESSEGESALLEAKSRADHVLTRRGTSELTGAEQPPRVDYRHLFDLRRKRKDSPSQQQQQGEEPRRMIKRPRRIRRNEQQQQIEEPVQIPDSIRDFIEQPAAAAAASAAPERTSAIFKFKEVNHGECCGISVSEDMTYEQLLRQIVAEKFTAFGDVVAEVTASPNAAGVIRPIKIIVRYKDDEGDWIICNSDASFKMAKMHAKFMLGQNPLAKMSCTVEFRPEQ
jgi:hypothetical protein